MEHENCSNVIKLKFNPLTFNLAEKKSHCQICKNETVNKLTFIADCRGISSNRYKFFACMPAILKTRNKVCFQKFGVYKCRRPIDAPPFLQLPPINRYSYEIIAYTSIGEIAVDVPCESRKIGSASVLFANTG